MLGKGFELRGLRGGRKPGNAGSKWLEVMGEGGGAVAMGSSVDSKNEFKFFP